MADLQKKFNPTKEYASNGNYYALRTQTLASSIDDLDSGLYRVYEKMQNDPKVSKCLYILKIRVLGNGLEIIPCFSESHPDYESAANVANFCAMLVKELENPLRYTLEQLLDGLVFGHKIAEVTWKQVVEKEGTYFLPTKIKVKANNLLNFVVDEFSNVVGFSFQGNLVSDSTGTVTVNNESSKIKINNKEFEFLSKDKFIYYTFKPKNEDPRGQSILRSAYNAWKFKQEVYPEYLRYLMMCAIPLLVGIAPEGVEETNILKDADGNIILDDSGSAEIMTTVEALMQALTNARNATAIAVKGGTKVEEVGKGAANGGGAPFYNALEYLNNEIEDSILLQTLATSQGVYQSRASSQIHMSTLDDFAFNIKQQLIDMLVNSIFKQAITYNLGSEYVKYMPIFTLGDTERRDFAADATAVAALKKVNWFTTDQMIKVDGMLGLPPRQNNVDDSSMTLSEIVSLNENLLNQENILETTKQKKARANLDKIKQLVELKTLLKSTDTENISTSAAATANDEIINELISTIAEEFKEDHKSSESNILGRIEELQNILSSKDSSKSSIRTGTNYYPNKSKLISFSDKLKKLVKVTSIDF